MAYIKICCIFSLLCALSTTAIATGSRSANEICKSLMQAKSYLFYRTDQFVLVSPLQYIWRNFNLFLLSICFCHLSTAINLSFFVLLFFVFLFFSFLQLILKLYLVVKDLWSQSTAASLVGWMHHQLSGVIKRIASLWMAQSITQAPIVYESAT